MSSDRTLRLPVRKGAASASMAPAALILRLIAPVHELR